MSVKEVKTLVSLDEVSFNVRKCEHNVFVLDNFLDRDEGRAVGQYHSHRSLC